MFIRRTIYFWEWQKMTDAFYLSQRWKRLRKFILRRDGYVCQYFKRFGKMCAAEIVHHIFPRELYPQFQWETWNLIALSAKAHRMMHNPDGSLSEIGLDLLRRTAEKRGIALDDREATHR